MMDKIQSLEQQIKELGDEEMTYEEYCYELHLLESQLKILTNGK